jgi:hypothetical protein
MNLKKLLLPLLEIISLSVANIMYITQFYALCAKNTQKCQTISQHANYCYGHCVQQDNKEILQTINMTWEMVTHTFHCYLLCNILTSAFCTFAVLISSEQVPMLTFLSDFAVIWQTAIIFLDCRSAIFLKLSFRGHLFAAQCSRNDVNVAEYKKQILFEIWNPMYNHYTLKEENWLCLISAESRANPPETLISLHTWK